ncbi:hypothetical protein HZB06_02110 [Candidatus Wolfebacteria bacterium]|nr:hypothetical protein [Candidatus Wolfebacteria bacterium]
MAKKMKKMTDIVKPVKITKSVSKQPAAALKSPAVSSEPIISSSVAAQVASSSVQARPEIKKVETKAEIKISETKTPEIKTQAQDQVSDPVQKTSPVDRHEVKKEKYRKAFEKELEDIDKKIEEFEKSEIKRFQEENDGKKRFGWKTYFIFGLAAIVFGAGIYWAVVFLPRAVIKITVQKTNWNYVDSVFASKNAVDIDLGQKKIPAEIFSQTKNFTFSFPATGRKQIQRKATVKILIYNNYSSSPQPLVASTRFEAPDGKIFRLQKAVVVPGAKVENGKVVPMSIEAEATADKAGEEYNIEQAVFTVPGLKGSPKYKGFYAESKEAARGGFVGEAVYPTEEDVKKARTEAVESLKNASESFVLSQIPKEFKIIDGAKQFYVNQEKLNEESDEKGNFNFFLEGTYSVIAFKESDFLELMKMLGRNNFNNDKLDINRSEAEYGVGRTDFNNGEISFAVNFRADLWQLPEISDDFRNKIAGKNEKELKDIIYSLPSIDRATVSFWPIWVGRVPSNIRQTEITVE